MKVEAQLCAALPQRDVDAGLRRADPPRPPHLPAEAALRQMPGRQRLQLLSQPDAAPERAVKARGRPRPRPAMTRAAFERLVTEAIALIPKRFRREIKNVALVVEDEPSPDLLEEMEIEPPDSLYGLYQGTPLTERSVGLRQHAARPHHPLPETDRGGLRGRGRSARRDRRDADSRGRPLLRSERGRDRRDRGAVLARRDAGARGGGLSPFDRARARRASDSASISSKRPGSRSSSTRSPRTPDDTFLEIGPGRGALTAPLAARSQTRRRRGNRSRPRRRICPRWFRDVHVVQADFLDVNLVRPAA